MTTYFELASATNANGRLVNSGTATGVDVQLLTSSFGIINLAAPSGSQGVPSIAWPCRTWRRSPPSQAMPLRPLQWRPGHSWVASPSR